MTNRRFSWPAYALVIVMSAAGMLVAMQARASHPEPRASGVAALPIAGFPVAAPRHLLP